MEANQIMPPGVDTTDLFSILQDTLVHAKKTGDSLLIGLALHYTGLYWDLQAQSLEDTDERTRLDNLALEQDKASLQYLSVLTYGALMSSPLDGLAEVHLDMALMQIDSDRKRDLLRTALGYSTDALTVTEKSTSLLNVPVWYTHSKILAYISKTEQDPKARKILLERALEYRVKNIKASAIWPFSYWPLGASLNYLAELKAELAGLVSGQDERKRLLEETIIDKESSWEYCLKSQDFIAKPTELWRFAVLGRWRQGYSDLLLRLGEITRETSYLKRAIDGFREAARLYEKADMPSREAECDWSAAQAFDRMGEHLKASESFVQASESFARASDKLPRLKDFYTDHSAYLLAWSSIEKAKHHHARQEYGFAGDHYRDAARLHASTKKWSYLTSNYSAWAQVEDSGELCDKGRDQNAIEAFKEAARRFSIAGEVLRGQKTIENQDESTLAKVLATASDIRSEYCRVRVMLEEGKVLDKEGDHAGSMRKYGEAVSVLEKLSKLAESEETKQELALFITLSGAWHAMARAEKEESPGLYLEASELFEKAKGFSSSQKMASLLLGHSRFCKALQSGAKFADTGTREFHAEAVQHLESAAKYYLKAGLEDAAIFAEATGLLFDAYLYMGEARETADQDKKSKLFLIAEKVLLSSAETFQKADQPAKKQQVQRILQKVRRDKELAVSLRDVLATTPIMSTSTFPSPEPLLERATGLQQFENADIRASLIAPKNKIIVVGDNLELEIQLANAGRGHAQLVKLENLVPNGFELKQKPESYRIEECDLNLKGKQLGPLKTEEFKLLLKAKTKGSYTLRPRVLYLDESGKYKSHEPEPIEVTVKELGISGWLKGR